MIRKASATLMAPDSAADSAAESRRMVPELLTMEERVELRGYEEKIRHGARAWLEMGEALTEIRDKRLYRETHESLDAYCWEAFRLERSTIYGLMSAARRYRVAQPFAEKLRIEFNCESHLRPLLRCQPSQLPAVLKLAAKNVAPDEDGIRRPTAKVLAKAVQEVKDGAIAPAAVRKAVAAAAPDSEAIKALPAWPDEALLRLARAVATELSARGIIPALRTPAATKPVQPKAAIARPAAATNGFVEYV